MIVVDGPLVHVTPQEALRIAQSLDLAIGMAQKGNRDRRVVGELRPLLEQFSRLAECRTERPTFRTAHPADKVRSVKDVATELGISERAVRARCQRGTLRAVLVERQWQILDDQEDVSA